MFDLVVCSNACKILDHTDEICFATFPEMFEGVNLKNGLKNDDAVNRFLSDFNTANLL